MKVEVKITEECDEPYVVIHTKSLSTEISKVVSMLQSNESIITAFEEDKIIVLRAEDIYMVRVENGEVILYPENNQYKSKKRLYEIMELLGHDFLQISKSAAINLKEIVSVESAFNGMMCLKLTNGCKEYISRKYLPGLKKYLGI